MIKFQYIITFLFFICLIIFAAGCKKAEYSLYVKILPISSGTVDLSPGGGTYTEGTEVTLTPKPGSDYKFISWSGTDASFVSRRMIVMNKNMDLTANFEINPQNGTWNGQYFNIANTDAIRFNINYGIITKDGSTIVSSGTTFSISVNYYFSNYTITKFFEEDIPIKNGSFFYSYGSENSSDGKQTIAGNFKSASLCEGKVTYDESYFDSSPREAHAEFDFVASP